MGSYEGISIKTKYILKHNSFYQLSKEYMIHSKAKKKTFTLEKDKIFSEDKLFWQKSDFVMKFFVSEFFSKEKNKILKYFFDRFFFF